MREGKGEEAKLLRPVGDGSVGSTLGVPLAVCDVLRVSRLPVTREKWGLSGVPGHAERPQPIHMGCRQSSDAQNL